MTAPTITSAGSLNLDRDLLLFMRESTNLADPIGPKWVHNFMENVTALGSSTVLLLITLLAAGFLFARQMPRSGLLLVLTVFAGRLMVSGLKDVFQRERPDVVVPMIDVSSASFPSGHAMNSAIVYITLAFIVARSLARPSLKIYVWAAAILITGLVGFSRIYLGVHWPTDVIAGWLIGALWVAVCFWALKVRGTPAPG